MKYEVLYTLTGRVVIDAKSQGEAEEKAESLSDIELSDGATDKSILDVKPIKKPKAQ
jgi:hypothetical protein